MKRYIFFIGFGIFISMTSCKHGEKHVGTAESHHPVYHEVMSIHDAVMPEMSTLHNLKRQLKTLAVDSVETDSVRILVKAIDDADEGMMSWMATFKEPQDQSAAEAYLKEEKVKIQKVSDDMHQAISSAQAYLNTHKK